MTSEQFYGEYGIPEYTGEGKLLDIYPCGSSNYQLCVVGATESEASEYISRLAERGYSLKRDIRLCKNVFAEYVKNGSSALVSYMPGISTLRVTCGKERELPKFEGVGDSSEAEPIVAQIGIRLGMCYCIALKDGTFAIVDGGCGNDRDVALLYSYLCERTKNGEKPIVSAWFMSHTHPDHMDLACDFMTRYRDEVDVRCAVYNFPNFQTLEVLNESAENNYARAQRFVACVRDNYPNALHYVCHTGQSLQLAGVKVTTLMTHEDIYPLPIKSSNHTSCAWRFDFESGSSFMCLGDIWREMCEQMAKTFDASYLKADVMQVTHHGLLGGHIDLYRAIDPETVLWPSPEDRFKGEFVDMRPSRAGKPTVQYCIGEGGCDYNAWIRDDAIKKRAHYHMGKTVEIPM